MIYLKFCELFQTSSISQFRNAADYRKQNFRHALHYLTQNYSNRENRESAFPRKTVYLETKTEITRVQPPHLVFSLKIWGRSPASIPWFIHPVSSSTILHRYRRRIKKKKTDYNIYRKGELGTPREILRPRRKRHWGLKSLRSCYR